MRKPAKKPRKTAGVTSEGGVTLPSGRAWERIEQFRHARGLDEVLPTETPKPGKPATTRVATKPKPRKKAKQP